MEPIKIEVTINVNVDMSQGTKDFVREVINSQIQAKSESIGQAFEPIKSVLAVLQTGLNAAPMPVMPEMPIQPASGAPAETAKAPQPEPQPEVPAKPEPQPEVPAKPEPQPSKEDKGTAPAIGIEDVRKALAEKVNDHRAAIKDKLTTLGAPSVTKLDPTKYQEMYDFLKSL